MLLRCKDCMVTFKTKGLEDCPSCGTADFIHQLSDKQVLAYENQKLKKENKELLSANINMHDALDLKSERIQELKKKLAIAIETLEDVAKSERGMQFRRDRNPARAKQALAEIGGEDE